MESWEIIEKTKRKTKQRKVHVSLNKRGEISMNLAAFAAIKEPANVTLLFDAKRRRIGVKFPVTRGQEFLSGEAVRPGKTHKSSWSPAAVATVRI